MIVRRYAPQFALQDVDAVLDRFFGQRGASAPAARPAEPRWYPAVNILEEAAGYRVEMEAPGLTEKEIQLSFAEGALAIKGERVVPAPAAGVHVHRSERQAGAFERAFNFGGEVDPDKIRARVENGLLVVDLPKRETARPREIRISGE